MGIKKTLSLIFTIISFHSSIEAADLYVGGALSYSGVISDSDYYNGASSALPAVTAGVDLGSIAFDTFFRIGTLTNTHENFDIDLDTQQFGFIFRLSPEEWMNINLGVHWTAVKGSSSIYNNQTLDGLIDTVYTSAVIGMGFNIPLSSRLRAYADLNYYLGKELFNLFQIDVAVVYTVVTF